MKRVILPLAPDPGSYPNPIEWQRATYRWMSDVKLQIEQASAVNDIPLDQAFQVSGTYAVTTAITGTATGTQITEFLCSLVDSMKRRGFLSPIAQGGTS